MDDIPKEIEQHLKNREHNVDLSNKALTVLPPTLVQLKDIAHRLALNHNLLSSLPQDMIEFRHLKYLNIRSNQFRSFPNVLCELPSLEILDISRNKIMRLPSDFGHLMQLKILSLSKNRIRTLPTYIGSMDQLKLLKLDDNPLEYPAPALCDHRGKNEAEWLKQLKHFLRENEMMRTTADQISLMSLRDGSVRSDRSSSPTRSASLKSSVVDLQLQRKDPNAGDRSTRTPVLMMDDEPLFSPSLENSFEYRVEAFLNFLNKRKSGPSSTQQDVTFSILMACILLRRTLKRNILDFLSLDEAPQLSELTALTDAMSMKVLSVLNSILDEDVSAVAIESYSNSSSAVVELLSLIKRLLVAVQNHSKFILGTIDLRIGKSLVTEIYVSLINTRDAYERLCPVQVHHVDTRRSKSRHAAPTRSIAPTDMHQSDTLHSAATSSTLPSSSASLPLGSPAAGRALVPIVENVINSSNYILTLLQRHVQGMMASSKRHPKLNEMTAMLSEAQRLTAALGNSIRDYSVQLNSDGSLLRRVYAEAGHFVNHSTRLIAFAKHAAVELALSKTIMSSLQTFTRTTRSLAIQLHGHAGSSASWKPNRSNLSSTHTPSSSTVSSSSARFPRGALDPRLQHQYDRSTSDTL